MYDPDEIEEEQRERERRNKINNEFNSFVKRVQVGCGSQEGCGLAFQHRKLNQTSLAVGESSSGRLELFRLWASLRACKTRSELLAVGIFWQDLLLGTKAPHDLYPHCCLALRPLMTSRHHHCSSLRPFTAFQKVHKRILLTNPNAHPSALVNHQS